MVGWMVSDPQPTQIQIWHLYTLSPSLEKKKEKKLHLRQNSTKVFLLILHIFPQYNYYTTILYSLFLIIFSIFFVQTLYDILSFATHA